MRLDTGNRVRGLPGTHHLDEYHYFVTPVVVGGGKRALPNDVHVELELLDERRFANGVVHFHYRTGS